MGRPEIMCFSGTPAVVSVKFRGVCICVFCVCVYTGFLQSLENLEKLEKLENLEKHSNFTSVREKSGKKLGIEESQGKVREFYK